MLVDGDGFLRSLRYPVLVWGAPPEAREDPLLLGTRTKDNAQTRPTSRSPLAFEVFKNAKNAMPQAVTIGRTANNDVAIEDNSVSRFHCYLVHDRAQGTWSVMDAESSNGTWLDGVKLKPKHPAVLQDGSVLRLAGVELTYYRPAAFIDYLRALANR
jgi:hypothetical protein